MQVRRQVISITIPDAAIFPGSLVTQSIVLVIPDHDIRLSLAPGVIKDSIVEVGSSAAHKSFAVAILDTISMHVVHDTVWLRGLLVT